MVATESDISTLQVMVDIRDGKLDPEASGIVPAIAADGGGESSIVAAGSLYILAELGLIEPRTCKKIVGISGGSLAAAATISGQHPEIYHTLTEELSERHFIDYARIARLRPMVDLSLLRGILEDKLDIKAIMNSPIELGFGVTKLDGGLEPVAISSRSVDEEDLLEWLMRGIHMPRVAGSPPVDENGVRWADGGLSWQTTSDIALTLGATHVLNLSNTPAKTWRYDGVQTDFVGKWLKRYGSPTNIDSYRTFAHAQIVKINGGTHPNVQIIYPDHEAELPGTFESNKRILRNGYIAGQNAVLTALELETIRQEARPQPNRNLLFQARNATLRFAGRSALRTVFTLAP